MPGWTGSRHASASWPISTPRACCVKIEPYELSLSKCQRCKTPVEPLVSTQWFIKTKPLAEPAIEVVEDGPHPLHPGELDQDLLRVDVQHPRLVHLAPALVGPSDSGVVLRVRRGDCRPRGAGGLFKMRLVEA